MFSMPQKGREVLAVGLNRSESKRLPFGGEWRRTGCPSWVKLGGKGRSATRLVVLNEQTLAGVGGLAAIINATIGAVVLLVIIGFFKRA